MMTDNVAPAVPEWTSVTDFNTVTTILGELWIDYKGDEAFEDFIQYNDLGLPLAYAVTQGLVDLHEQGVLYIAETWDLLVEALSLDETVVWESLDDMLENSLQGFPTDDDDVDSAEV